MPWDLTSARERRDTKTLVIAGVIFIWQKRKQEKHLDRYHHGRRASSHNINNSIMLSEARHHNSIIHRAITLWEMLIKEICSPLGIRICSNGASNWKCRGKYSNSVDERAIEQRVGCKLWDHVMIYKAHAFPVRQSGWFLFFFQREWRCNKKKNLVWFSRRQLHNCVESVEEMAEGS